MTIGIQWGSNDLLKSSEQLMPLTGESELGYSQICSRGQRTLVENNP